jgi:hypothetical protein
MAEQRAHPSCPVAGESIPARRPLLKSRDEVRAEALQCPRREEIPDHDHAVHLQNGHDLFDGRGV